MKIVVTADGPSLDAMVDPRFGRCPCFLIVDTDGGGFEAVDNANVVLGGGAGIQSARLVAEKGAQAVLTGNCGPNAFQALSAAGIEVITGCSGPVKDALEAYKAGRLRPAGGSGVAARAGMGMAPGTPAQENPDLPKDQQLEMLRRQADAAARQMEQIQARIREIEKET